MSTEDKLRKQIKKLELENERLAEKLERAMEMRQLLQGDASTVQDYEDKISELQEERDTAISDAESESARYGEVIDAIEEMEGEIDDMIQQLERVTLGGSYAAQFEISTVDLLKTLKEWKRDLKNAQE